MARSPIGPHDNVLITGASSGIGAGLAAAMHQRGATVTITGRDRGRLDAVAARHPGMRAIVMDVSDPGSIDAAAAELSADGGSLTVLVNNAGVQRLADFTATTPPRASDVSSEIDTNFTGQVHVAGAFLPLLRRAPRARLVNVTSGLAFIPLTRAPVYSATKAAVRSFSISLRRQLAGSTVQVVELVPPVVATELHRHLPEPPPMAMALDAFVAAAMKGLDAGKDEIAVGLARPLRIGARVAPARFLALVNRG